ncbi:MAG TPA: HD domain-containing protein [Clostridia bacterium]|nr:HD domain-containing protein [Clostridia bacterium]
MITFEQIKADPAIKTYITEADSLLAALGYTEHSFAHVGRVADIAKYILLTMGYSEREAELAQIASWLHDIGNIVNRADHAQSGALMAFRILEDLGGGPEDIAKIIAAIGNHDEGTAEPISAIASALILADKTDVRYTRVRAQDPAKFDIHDRVNFAVREGKTYIDEERESITLNMTIDTHYCSVMDYFEIFLERMLLCRRAAEFFKLTFRLIVNGQRLL